LYFELEDWDKAIALYKRNIQNNPDDVLATSNLAETYEAMGLYDSAIKTLERFLQRNPERIGFYLKQAEIHLYQGKYDLATAKLGKALSLDPKIQNSYDIHLGIISLLKGDMTSAEKQFQKLPEESPERRYHMINIFLHQGKFEQAKSQLSMTPILHESLAYFFLRTGHPKEAIQEFNSAVEKAAQTESLSSKTRLLHAKGIAYAQMKSFEEASRIAKEIRDGIPPWMQKKLMRYYNHLMGTIKLERGELAEAIRFLKKAEQSLYAPEENFPQIQAWFIFSLAEACRKAGDLELAQQKYETVLSLHLGRLNYGDFYARSYYMLGKIFERKGQMKRAVESYEHFLELWKNADPGIEEVGEARERVDALKSS
jgi:tetratricopeptide (TPR) repeat protein